MAEGADDPAPASGLAGSAPGSESPRPPSAPASGETASETPSAVAPPTSRAAGSEATRRTCPSPVTAKTRPFSTKDPTTGSGEPEAAPAGAPAGERVTSQLTMGMPAASRVARGALRPSPSGTRVSPAPPSAIASAFSAESASPAVSEPSARAGESASTPPAFCRQGVKGHQAERQGKGQAGASEGAREARRGATAAARGSHCGCSLPDRKQVFPYPSRPLGRIPGPHRTARTLARPRPSPQARPRIACS